MDIKGIILMEQQEKQQAHLLERKHVLAEVVVDAKFWTLSNLQVLSCRGDCY